MRKLIICALLLSCVNLFAQAKAKGNMPDANSDLRSNSLPKVWDEAMALGNAYLGALVWQRGESKLRMSLDRADLWDLRPTDSIVQNPKTFDWVYRAVKSGDYRPVQLKYDVSYDASSAPSKIPGAALEFDIKALGKVSSVHLSLGEALCRVKWKNGASLETFVHAEAQVGWFVFRGLKGEILPDLIAPSYGSGAKSGSTVSGQSLSRLGYPQGQIERQGSTIRYHQQGWGDFSYDVVVRYKRTKDMLVGVWSIASSTSGLDADLITEQALAQSVDSQLAGHKEWWSRYWNRSSICIPDTILQKQYDNEMYKFGSLAREQGPIITLQGVWTADNGLLPPWKGDVHNDLNTELSYWPAYTGNHLEQGYGYLHTLWQNRDENLRFTKQFFQIDGLNVPGVVTLTGEPMGGWIQYAFSPTTSSWLAQHFYLHWRYSMDRDFLAKVGYPYVSQVAQFVENFSKLDSSGKRSFPLSSSPEIYDNSIRAWFPTMTNYDLALVKSALGAASEMAHELGLDDKTNHWRMIGEQFGQFDLAADSSLTFAAGHPYSESHRHLANAMAIHPFSLIDIARSEDERKIVQATIARFDSVGPDGWCGYTYSWLANMKARSYDGQGAAVALRDFAQCFCLSNTFHVNGDQTNLNKSKLKYRPFTLEGNLAFAAGVQEMLIQSHRGYVEVFPAIPSSWKSVSFNTLRTQGAFLVSARMVNSVIDKVEVESLAGEDFYLMNPFAVGSSITVRGARLVGQVDGVLHIEARRGSKFSISRR